MVVGLDSTVDLHIVDRDTVVLGNTVGLDFVLDIAVADDIAVPETVHLPADRCVDVSHPVQL